MNVRYLLSRVEIVEKFKIIMTDVEDPAVMDMIITVATKLFYTSRTRP